MIFVFGFGHRTTKDYGPALPIKCPNCHNQTYWRYLHHRIWFTLFFIPAIPYSSEHEMVCDICREGVILTKDEAVRAKVLAGYTKLFLEHQLSQSEYDIRVREANLFR